VSSRKLSAAGFSPIFENQFLLFRKHLRLPHHRYGNRCTLPIAVECESTHGPFFQRKIQKSQNVKRKAQNGKKFLGAVVKVKEQEPPKG
jgi:hypothetical protein